MVENTVSEDQEQAQFDQEILKEYDRAKSDYMYVSKNYPNYYAVAGYIEAEERAWERFEKAFQALQELDS